MVKPAEEQYRQFLSALKLPQESIDYICTRCDPAKAVRLYWLGFIAYIALILGFGAGAFFLSRHLLFTDLMESRTQGTGTLFYESLWGFHLVPAMLLAILLPALIIYAVLDKFPNAAELVALKAIDDTVWRNMPRNYVYTAASAGAGAIEMMFLDETFRKLPIHEALRYYNRKFIRWTKWGSIFSIILMIPFIITDAANYTVVTPDGVRMVHYGHFSPREETWGDVKKVSTGCYHEEGMRRPVTLKYEISFNDGSVVDLYDEDGTLIGALDGLLRLDTNLRKMGKSFDIGKLSHGDHRGETMLNQGCFSELKSLYPQDYPKLITLLHLEKYPVARR